MAHPLVLESKSQVEADSGVVVVDYNVHPQFCRSGVWVGVRHDFTETIVLSFEHDPDPLYVGWALNGVTVIDPGFSAGTSFFPGAPVPGLTGLTYVCPYKGLYHKLALRASPGTVSQCLTVQVLLRPMGSTNPLGPAQLGPQTYQCISGSRVVWPTIKLDEEQRCRDAFMELLRRYAKSARIRPTDPVEHWLEQGDPAQLVRLGNLLQALEQVDRERDEEIVSAIEDDLRGIVESFRQTQLSTGVAPASS